MGAGTAMTPPPRESAWQRLGRWGKAGVVLVVTALLSAAGAAAWGLLARGAQERLTRAVDVSVQVDPSYWKQTRPNWTPYFYWLPVADPARLSTPPPDCRDRRPWAFSQGGADADESRVAFTLRGSRAGEVSLEAMRVEVESRTPAVGGVVAACPVGGGTAEIHGLEVDLDRETVRFVDAGESVPARITLEEGETEAFDLYATTAKQGEVVKWRLVLTVVDGENREPVTIDDEGETFRTVGTAGTPMVVWRSGGWQKYEP